MATSQSFAEKIKQLEQQGKDLLSKGICIYMNVQYTTTMGSVFESDF